MVSLGPDAASSACCRGSLGECCDVSSSSHVTVVLLQMFESCTISNHSAHPDAADVGDALFINTEWSMVEEIALQYTMVQRYDGVRIWWPNHVLCNGAVMNISRSAFRWESYKVGGTQWARWSGIIAALHAGLRLGLQAASAQTCCSQGTGRLPGQARALQRLPLRWSSLQALEPAMSSRHMDRQQTWPSHRLPWQHGCP